MDKIDLIASGYEWECPKCKNFNKEIALKSVYTCDKCGKEFEQGFVNDALDI
jgi:ribosomal protein L37AE/L43A